MGKNALFLKKNAQKFGGITEKQYLCIVKEKEQPIIITIKKTTIMKKTEIIKTMNNRIEVAKECKKNGVYKNIWVKGCKEIIAAVEEGRVIRTCTVKGYGRHIHNEDLTLAYMAELCAAGIPYKKYNDAPRGGACGNYITIIVEE